MSFYYTTDNKNFKLKGCKADCEKEHNYYHAYNCGEDFIVTDDDGCIYKITPDGLCTHVSTGYEVFGYTSYNNVLYSNDKYIFICYGPKQKTVKYSFDLIELRSLNLPDKILKTGYSNIHAVVTDTELVLFSNNVIAKIQLSDFQ